MNPFHQTIKSFTTYAGNGSTVAFCDDEKMKNVNGKITLLLFYENRLHKRCAYTRSSTRTLLIYRQWRQQRMVKQQKKIKIKKSNNQRNGMVHVANRTTNERHSLADMAKSRSDHFYFVRMMNSTKHFENSFGTTTTKMASLLLSSIFCHLIGLPLK